MSKVFTTGEILGNLHRLSEEIKQVQTCLKSLRGSAWKTEIGKDTRPFVQELYQKLQKLEMEHESFMNTTWKEVE